LYVACFPQPLLLQWTSLLYIGAVS
jgi:hypothetical protein